MYRGDPCNQTDRSVVARRARPPALEGLERRIHFAAGKLPEVTATFTRPETGNIYYLLSPSNWTDAEAKAVQLGGHLVTINDAAENQFVRNMRFGSHFLLWLGLNDESNPGQFVWSSGEPVSYINWDEGQPDGFVRNPVEHHVLMLTFDPDGVWHDFPNLATHPPTGNLPAYGVVEVPGTGSAAPPAASLAPVQPIPIRGNEFYEVEIIYSAGPGFADTTFGDDDLVLIGPNPDGTRRAAAFFSRNPTKSGDVRVRYRIPAPDGADPAAGNGSYAVELQTGAVVDNAGGTVPGGFLGSVNIRVPDFDLGFGEAGTVDFDFVAEDVAVQDDGKVVVVGHGTDFDTSEFIVQRLKEDGTPDLDFGTGGNVVSRFGEASAAYTVSIQADGKIVVAGSADHNSLAPNYTRMVTARFLPNGLPDVGFGANNPDEDGVEAAIVEDFDEGPETLVGFDSLVDPDGQVLVLGSGFPSLTDQRRLTSLFRYTPDGDATSRRDVVLDNTEFAGRSLALQSDRKILVAGSQRHPEGDDHDFAVLRHTSDLQLDSLFNAGTPFTIDFEGGDDTARSIAVQPDDRIVIAGGAVSAGIPQFALARLDNGGSLDTSFDQDGKVITPFDGLSRATSVIVEVDDPTVDLVAAGIVEADGIKRGAVVRYNFDGSLEAGFGAGGKLLQDLPSHPPLFSASDAAVDDQLPDDFAKFFEQVRAIVARTKGGAIYLLAINSGNVTLQRLEMLPQDLDAPGALMIAENIDSAVHSAVLIVQYFDSSGIDAATLGPSDLRIKGPNDFDALARFDMFGKDGLDVIGFYLVDAPGAETATFGPVHNGTYQVFIEADEVHDKSGNAVRAEMLGTFEVEVPEVSPEVSVNGDTGAVISDGSQAATGNGTDFGSVPLNGQPVQRTFTVTNSGSGFLTLGAVQLPTGFVLIQSLPIFIQPQSSESFIVELSTDAVGERNGRIFFTTNVPGRETFDFGVKGVVRAVSPEPPAPVSLTDVLAALPAAIVVGDKKAGGKLSVTVRNDSEDELLVDVGIYDSADGAYDASDRKIAHQKKPLKLSSGASKTVKFKPSLRDVVAGNRTLLVVATVGATHRATVGATIDVAPPLVRLTGSTSPFPRVMPLRFGKKVSLSISLSNEGNVATTKALAEYSLIVTSDGTEATSISQRAAVGKLKLKPGTTRPQKLSGIFEAGAFAAGSYVLIVRLMSAELNDTNGETVALIPVRIE